MEHPNYTVIRVTRAAMNGYYNSNAGHIVLPIVNVVYRLLLSRQTQATKY